MHDWNLAVGAPKISLSLEHARTLASEIAKGYFDSGMAPTDILSKIAATEELTPHQIEIVAAEANKHIHNVKFANEENKYAAADFPLADARKVIAELQLVGEEKVANLFVPPQIQAEDINFFGVEVEPMKKTASEMKGDLRLAAEKLAHYKSKLDDKNLILEDAEKTAERVLIKQARKLALEGQNSTERLQILGSLYKFAKEAQMEEVAKPVLAKTAFTLHSEGLLETSQAKVAHSFFTSKTADQKAPISLISENLMGKVMIVNGQHPLYIGLKTLKNHHDSFLHNQQQSSLVDDKLDAVRQKIREL